MDKSDEILEVVKKNSAQIENLTKTVGISSEQIKELAKTVGINSEQIQELTKTVDINSEQIKELTEVVFFMKDRMATKEDLDLVKAELKRDIHGLGNRLDDELDKRKALEVRVGKLENAS
jgi:predicted RNase H-like nuclease (RuvC/YqgF family)